MSRKKNTISNKENDFRRCRQCVYLCVQLYSSFLYWILPCASCVRQQQRKKITLGLYWIFLMLVTHHFIRSFLLFFLYHFNHNRCQLQKKSLRGKNVCQWNLKTRNNNNAKSQQYTEEIIRTKVADATFITITMDDERRGKKIEPCAMHTCIKCVLFFIWVIMF